MLPEQWHLFHTSQVRQLSDEYPLNRQRSSDRGSAVSPAVYNASYTLASICYHSVVLLHVKSQVVSEQSKRTLNRKSTQQGYTSCQVQLISLMFSI